MIPVFISVGVSFLIYRFELVNKALLQELLDGNVEQGFWGAIVWLLTYLTCTCFFHSFVPVKITKSLYEEAIGILFSIAACLPFASFYFLLSEAENFAISVSYSEIAVDYLTTWQRIALGISVLSIFLASWLHHLSYQICNEIKPNSWAKSVGAIICVTSPLIFIVMVGWSFKIEYTSIFGLSPIFTVFSATSIWIISICGLPFAILTFLRYVKRLAFGKAGHNTGPIVPSNLKFADDRWILFSPQLASFFLVIGLTLTFQVASFSTDGLQNSELPPKLEKNSLASVQDHLEKWVNERYPNGSVHEANAVPLIFVSSAGGGLKSAIWTATVLERIVSENPKIMKHLWSASGVSGGALGIATFFGALSDMDSLEIPVQRECKVGNPVDGYILLENKLSSCLETFFRKDALSPVIAAFFLREPFPYVFSKSRTDVLIEAWSSNWSDTLRNDALKAKLDELKLGFYKTPPVVMLNSTIVETGDRFILSNLDLLRADFDGHFVERDLGLEDTTVAQAVAMSATFPGISNAYPLVVHCPVLEEYKSGNTNHQYLCMENGYLRHNQIVWGNTVDGGYYDNSGSRTTANLIKTTLKAWKDLGYRGTPIPIVIQIRPSEFSGFDDKNDGVIGVPDFKPLNISRFSAEGPANALLNARSSHGKARMDDMAEFLDNTRTSGSDVLSDEAIKFRPVHLTAELCNGEEFPLSWSMASEDIKKIYSSGGLCLTNNGFIEKLLEAIRVN